MPLQHLHVHGAGEAPASCGAGWAQARWGHVTPGPRGCCRLPAAVGVFAQHGAASSDDPGAAAVGRCQTPALEQPLASHQPRPPPRHRSRQLHTRLGAGTRTLPLRGWCCCPAPALPRSHGCRRLGGTEVPRAWWGTSTQWLPSPMGRIWGSSSVPPGGPLTAQGNGAKGSCRGPLARAHQPITSLPGGATLSCQCCRKGHVGMEQGTSTAGLAGEQREPRATTPRLSTSPAAASQSLGDRCALVAPMWGLQASPQTHRRVQHSPRSPRMPWCFGPRSAHRGLGERGPLHQLWCGDNSPGPHSVPAGLGAKGRRSHHAGRGGGSS